MTELKKWYVMGDDEGPEGPYLEISAGECPSPEYESIARVYGSGDDFELTEKDNERARLIAEAPAMVELLKEGQSPADERGYLEWSRDVQALLKRLEGNKE